jgi:IMP cyclohydrolase
VSETGETDAMASVDDLHALSGYPGRGIAVHRTDDGELRWAYFLTGRSPSSQARRFVRRPGALAVGPTDAGAEFDELRHYLCATGVDGSEHIVVGNGDHVAVIAQRLASGLSLVEAIQEVAPEPDPPINTPRIAAVLGRDGAELVIVRDLGGQPERLVHPVVLSRNEGVVVRTYAGDVENPVGTAPILRFTCPPAASVPELIWAALDPALRVVLAAGRADSPEPTRLLG